MTEELLCTVVPQVYDLQVSTTAVPAGAHEMSGGAELGEAQQRFVEQADTFFVATSYAGSAEDAAHPGAAYIGCDVSNRGGPPGFVRLLGPSTLIWPDYIGNFFFMTLGALSCLCMTHVKGACICVGNSGLASTECEQASVACVGDAEHTGRFLVAQACCVSGLFRQHLGKRPRGPLIHRLLHRRHPAHLRQAHCMIYVFI